MPQYCGKLDFGASAMQNGTLHQLKLCEAGPLLRSNSLKPS